MHLHAGVPRTSAGGAAPIQRRATTVSCSPLGMRGLGLARSSRTTGFSAVSQGQRLARNPVSAVPIQQDAPALNQVQLQPHQPVAGPPHALVPAMLGAVCVLGSLLAPGAAHASGGTLTGQSVEMFKDFLDGVEALGPWGGLVFVAVVMVFEMVPLFPTQPLSLASGLLFGAKKGALLMLLGVTLAAVNAFLIARGVGRPLAQKVIDAEMSHSMDDGDSQGAITRTLAQVQTAIEGGGLWKQLTAITLLRLTPVVPFSASNYLLGLTPVQLPAFLGGTLVGMSVWSTLYASLGGASRALLDKGADLETLLADLGDKAGALSSNAVGATAALVGAGVLAYVVRRNTQSQQVPASNEDAPGSSATKDVSASSASPLGSWWGSASGTTSGDEASTTNGNGRGRTPVSSLVGRGRNSTTSQGD